MVDTGLCATELGPDGYLPTDPTELKDYLAGYGLTVVGGFVPALLYRPDRLEAELEYVRRASRQLASSGSKILVLGPSNDNAGYDRSTEMSEEEWNQFFVGLRRLQDVAAVHGLATAVHPHWGMAIERPNQVERLLESSEAGLCLDTGHIFLGGGDPVELARMAVNRVIHVHLKDVSQDAAERVRSGEIAFRQAVIEGMFVPLGEGAVDIAGVIRQLEAGGYQGWYVLEQDVSLTGEPGMGEGPIVDAETSVDYLRRLAAQL
jgi:inosose dehydratase